MSRQRLELALLPGEYWWGGVVPDGPAMPFGAADFGRDLRQGLAAGQGVALLLSSKGRYIWSEEPFAFSFADGCLRLAGDAAIACGDGHANLAGAFRHAAQRYFSPDGGMPDPLFFTAPQYNTWIEMGYEPTQEKVLAYAEAILAHDLPPGVLIIDDNWQEDYGVWRFHPHRFPDPARMIAQLHNLGFKVLLWVCPFISPDCATFRWLEGNGYCVRQVDGSTAVRQWWNGHSAVLDCTNDGAVAWYREQLDRLVDEFGVDGFKFDGGDPEYYRPDDICARPTSPHDQCEQWARLGLHYAAAEYRACWKLAGQPLVQRLRDKRHAWGGEGLATLLPEGLAQGLLGYAFGCPDMIGGGEIGSFSVASFHLDQELFVRYAQCAALFPMMQFSAAPWRVLDRRHVEYCLAAARLHTRLGDEIVGLAERAAQSGEPIMRHLAYVFPDGGYEQVGDQFMLGDDVLVAPVIEKGAEARQVVFPPGTWLGDDSSVVQGPAVLEVDAPLSRLPWYRRQQIQGDQQA